MDQVKLPPEWATHSFVDAKPGETGFVPPSALFADPESNLWLRGHTDVRKALSAGCVLVERTQEGVKIDVTGCSADQRQMEQLPKLGWSEIYINNGWLPVVELKK
jgi:hypothetical protein